MKRLITAGATSQTVYVLVLDSSSTTGAGLTGLAYNTASLVAYYVRDLAAAAAITLATQTVTGAWSSGGFVEVSSANTPGLYRLDLPDAVVAAGVSNVVVILKGATNMVPVALEIQLAGGQIGAITGNTVQTGDAYARLGAAGAGLTAIGDTRMAYLDALVSSRLAAAGYTAPPSSAANASQVRTELTTELARIDTAISTRLAAAGYAAPPTAAENADATLDELLSGHAIPGSAGAALSAAGGAADPLSNAVPGSYAAGSAGYILGNLPDRTVNVVSPILSGQDLEFNHGFDYLAADGRSEDVTVSTWPTLTGATVVLKFGGLTWSVISVTAATTIRIAIPRARWGDIPLSEGTIQYGYVIQATLTNADVVDLMTGTLRVTKL